MKFIKIAFFTVLIYICRCFLYSQVTVAPTLVAINDKDPNAYIYIKNSGTIKIEVRTEIFFGYFDSDSLGETQFILNDSVKNSPSAAGWTSVYPKNFFLLPNEDKRLRIIAREPGGLKQGEYWARLKILTQPAQGEERTNSDTGKINPRMNINFNFILPVYFRKGKVSTGISILNITEELKKDKLLIHADLKREGSAAYLGNILIRIKDENGKTMEESWRETVVYYNQREIFEFPIGKFQNGKYYAEVELNTKRKNKENIIESETVIKSKIFNITVSK